MQINFNQQFMRVQLYFLASFCVLFTFFFELAAQSLPSDTSHISLTEVQVNAYILPQSLFKSTASAARISTQQFHSQASHQPVHAFNSVAGVRMEERSPGSYRLSIRGSLLRSPFGVRNVKVYLDDLPFTDAGGNTYINLIDPIFLSSAEVLKGPDGSFFGANSGGVVILNTHRPSSLQETDLQVQAQGGSFGLYHHQAALQSVTSSKYSFTLNHAYQRSDGYREQSGLRKFFTHTRHLWQYAKHREIDFQLLFTDIHYQTPGGLTLAQFQANPQASRPATAATPSALEQNAGIYNTTVFGGLSHRWNMTSNLKHHISIFGSHTDFKNPFITNYEIRDEHNTGLRTHLSYETLIKTLNLNFQGGLEWQYGKYDIQNFDNNRGVIGNVQSTDLFKTKIGTYFLKAQLEKENHWQIEASLSYNAQHHNISSGNTAAEALTVPEAWMPRIATSIALATQLRIRGVVSKGFSPPTVAEIRPSDNVVNRDLSAEWGWNKEIGLRWISAQPLIQVDLSAFSYALQNAIVRGTRANGAEYFLNAGKTIQNGVEAQMQSKFYQNFGGMQWHWLASYTWSNFKFDEYQINGKEFSKNNLTGVPQHQVYTGLGWTFLHHWTAWLHFQYTEKIPLTDANNVWADPYHLIHAKLSWRTQIDKKQAKNLEFFVGAENLLNENYSLGNDINAFGSRFFNPAPLRNYFFGLRFSLL